MLPGGKPEAGETAVEAAVRECGEEIGVALAPTDLVELGVFTAPAANEPGFTVRATVYTSPMRINPVRAAEIAELRWIDPVNPGATPLAPLLSERVLPIL